MSNPVNFASLTVDFDGIRLNLIDSFKDLSDFVRRAPITSIEDYRMDKWRLHQLLNSLRDDIVVISSIINPETNKSLLDDNFDLPRFDDADDI